MSSSSTSTPSRGAARRRAGALVLTLAAAGVLVACASGEPGADGTADATTPEPDPASTPLELVAGSTVVGLPDGIGPQPADAQAGAARTSDASLLYVVTFGSSTCPGVPDAMAEDAGDGAVVLTFPEPGDGACTADYVPSTTVVELPGTVDTDADLTVRIGQAGEVVLPAGSEDVVWSIASS